MKSLLLHRNISLLIIIGSVLFNLAIFSAPLFLYSNCQNVASCNYSIFSPICHQLNSRTFFLLGYPLAACARCTGIYLGFLAGLLYLSCTLRKPLRQAPAKIYFFLFITPVVLDFVLNASGAMTSPHAWRALTGFLLGVVLPFYIMPGICEIGSQCVFKFHLSCKEKFMP